MCDLMGWDGFQAAFCGKGGFFVAGDWGIVRQPEKRGGALWLAFYLEPVFTISIGRFYDIKARIQGKKHSKVGHLASIFNAVAAFLGH